MDFYQLQDPAWVPCNHCSCLQSVQRGYSRSTIRLFIYNYVAQLPAASCPSLLQEFLTSALHGLVRVKLTHHITRFIQVDNWIRVPTLISYMKFPLTLLGLASQVPFQTPLHTASKMAAATIQSGFSFKEGSDIFSPRDLVGLVFCKQYIVSELSSRSK